MAVRANILVPLLVSFGGLQLQAAVPAERTVELTGYAYDRSTDEFLYMEQHRIVMQDDHAITHRIDYRDDRGRTFANKVLDYRPHPYAPTFRTTDLRDGYLEGGVHTERGYQLQRRLHGEAPIENAIVPSGVDLVADSGFDRYVKAQLDELLRVGRGEMRMAVAGQLEDYRFAVKLVERIVLYEQEAVVFRVQPSTLLSIFVDPIYITYDINTGNLLRYAGTSNIRSPSGERYDTRIDFPPDGKPPVKQGSKSGGK